MTRQDYVKALQQINVMQDLAQATYDAFKFFVACDDEELRDILQGWIESNLSVLSISNSKELIQANVNDTNRIFENYEEELKELED